MEYYMKVSENEKSATEPSNEPHHILITNDCKFYQSVRNAVKLLKQHQKLLITGEAELSSKAIAVADKIKEQHHVSVTIDVCSTEYKDVWIPKSPDLALENLEVTRAMPTTKILILYAEESHQQHQVKSYAQNNSQSPPKKEGFHDRNRRNYLDGENRQQRIGDVHKKQHKFSDKPQRVQRNSDQHTCTANPKQYRFDEKKKNNYEQSYKGYKKDENWKSNSSIIDRPGGKTKKEPFPHDQDGSETTQRNPTRPSPRPENHSPEELNHDQSKIKTALEQNGFHGTEKKQRDVKPKSQKSYQQTANKSQRRPPRERATNTKQREENEP